MERQIRLALAQLVVYNSILKDDVFAAFRKWLFYLHKKGEEALITQEAYYRLLNTVLNTGMSFKQYLLYLLQYDDNVFSQKAEETEWESMPSDLKQAVVHDLQRLQFVYSADWQSLMDAPFRLTEADAGHDQVSPDDSVFGRLSISGEWPALGPELARHYSCNSRGIVAQYDVLVWDSERRVLVGADSSSMPLMSDIIGCVSQKELLIHNTQVFLQGGSGNNVLLYGPRGTGKSSLVKSLVGRYRHLGVKLVEISREKLEDLPLLVEEIRKYPCRRFIVFIDDLSFEDYETGYKGLKAVLDGSIRAKSPNMLIYATSNRRNLVKEFFSDRGRLGDEVHYQDTMQEKLSLADRFGLTITFPAPGQKLYLEIVQYWAKQKGVMIEPEVLREKALEWERSYHGPSGRSARQFVDSLG